MVAQVMLEEWILFERVKQSYLILFVFGQ